MNFLKSNYKMILVIFVSIVVQIVVLLMLLNPLDKEKKEIDSTIAREDTNTIAYDEMDSIDQSKNNLINGQGIDEAEDLEGDSQENEIEKPVSQVGRVDVQVGYNPTEPVVGKAKTPRQITSNKTKLPAKTTTTSKQPSTASKPPVKPKPNDDKKKVDSLEKVEKVIVGKWKSENDSDGRKADMYWEFFKDGTYQNYDEDKSVVFNGKYTVNSPNIIKIDQENVYLSATGNTRNQSETFSVDINFKDDKGFSVTDINHFDFSNYKKVK